MYDTLGTDEAALSPGCRSSSDEHVACITSCEGSGVHHGHSASNHHISCMHREVLLGGTTEITEDLRGSDAGSTWQVRVKLRKHWYLGNVYDLSKEEEIVFLMFKDPKIEQEYRVYTCFNSRRSDVFSLGMSVLVSLVFTWKGEFKTYSAFVLRYLVTVGVMANVACLTILKMAPGLGYAIRSPLIVSLRLYSHILVLSLPPLSFSGLKTPSSVMGVYMLLMQYQRVFQNLFVTGVWSSAGFFPALMLLTILMFTAFHWNQEECEMLCALQPQITAHYQDVYRWIPSALIAGTTPMSTVDLCIACRCVCQVVLGCCLPLFLGIKREIASRTAFVNQKGIATRPLSFSDIVFQVAAIIAHVLASIAVISLVFTLVPELDHLPTLLTTGKVIV
eukprot:jgi/Botrbrau1/13307/Bobra.0315s0005.1